MVSHSMADIRTFCDAGLVLHQSQIEVSEDVEEAIARHQEIMFRAVYALICTSEDRRSGLILAVFFPTCARGKGIRGQADR